LRVEYERVGDLFGIGVPLVGSLRARQEDRVEVLAFVFPTAVLEVVAVLREGFTDEYGGAALRVNFSSVADRGRVDGVEGDVKDVVD